MTQAPLSPALRAAVFIGYGALLCVNGIFGSGAFGVPTNAELSGAYPSPVTPAGFTFAIWGPIFLLQAGGTLLMTVGRAKALGAAAAVPWLSAWFFECAWQLLFAKVPIKDGAASGTAAERLAVLVPCFFCLAAAQASMCLAAARIGPADAAESLLIALPTGLNAAWLAAATGIGLALVLTEVGLGGAAAGATLLSAVLAAAAFVVPALLKKSTALGLGYAAATCWACFGMQHGGAPLVVKNVAAGGGVVVAVAALAGIAAARGATPAPDDELKLTGGEKTYI